MSSHETTNAPGTIEPAARKRLLELHAMPPDQIETRSFEIIDGLIPPLNMSYGESQTVKRIIHTTGDPSILPQISFNEQAIAAGVAAIKRGAPIFTDTKMVSAGISRPHAAIFGCAVRCLIDEPAVVETARERGITRSAASVFAVEGESDGAIMAIGNAPTALFALLDLIDEGRSKPALVIGMPVGFVGAAESKAELVKRDIPFITIVGTRGGSTLAAATVNALLRVAAAEKREEK